MKKRMLVGSGCSALFIVLLISIFRVNQRKAIQKDYSYANQSFSWVSLAGKPVNPIGQRKVALVKFDSDCEHCKQELREFTRNREFFGKKSVYFISNESDTVLKAVDKLNQLSATEEFTILRDSIGTMGSTFSVFITPSTLIFNEKGVLIRQFTGQVKAKTVAELLK